VGCRIEIWSHAGDANVRAGIGEKLRVSGAIIGSQQPANPVWTWTVTRGGQGVTPTPDSMDPATIEFGIEEEGTYVISASVQATPRCEGKTEVTTTITPFVPYHVRITPPRGNMDLAPHDETIKVRGGMPMHSTFSFERAVSVEVDPRTSSNLDLRAYVRISSAGRSWLRESDTTRGAFGTTLVDDPSWLYDVLIVPLEATKAPILFTSYTAVRWANTMRGGVIVEPGVPVTGILAVAGDAPVKDAVVLLRDGALPSTLGKSDAAGAFSLLAREGRFSAVILPPSGPPISALPEAHVREGEPILLPASADAPVQLRFEWRADLGARTLSARFTRSDGSPAADLDVRLDSAEDALPNVGLLRVTNNGIVDQAIETAGAVHRTAKTDPTGIALFERLPRASYQLMGVPGATSSDGVTVMPVDLTAAVTASTTVSVRLAPKVTVSGKLTGAPAGTRIIVIDAQPVPVVGHDFMPAPLGADGAYTLKLDPGRTYYLLADPPAGKGVSRVPLGVVETRSSPIEQGTRALPRMLAFTGRVQRFGGMIDVAGAKVQVFCQGTGPDCVDPPQLPGRDPLPLMEGLTDDRGGFSLWIPDPRLAACTPGEDQTCNDKPTLSALLGHCLNNGTCMCSAGSALVAGSGRCATP
jgi:hypothetical protein